MTNVTTSSSYSSGRTPYANWVLFAAGLLYDLALPVLLASNLVRSYVTPPPWYQSVLEGYAFPFFIPLNQLIMWLTMQFRINNPSFAAATLLSLYLSIPVYALATLLIRRRFRKQAQLLVALAAVNVVAAIIVNTLWVY